MIFLVFCLNVHILSPFEVSSLANFLNFFMMLLMQEARKRFDKANVTYDQVGITPQLLRIWILRYNLNTSSSVTDLQKKKGGRNLHLTFIFCLEFMVFR